MCTSGSTAVSGYSGAGIVADCNTLLGLMDELRGTESLNWSVDTAMASWDGITVSGNRVTELDSSGKEFTGSIPSELAQLTSLTTLELFSNNTESVGPLSGSIPPELGQLTNLETLVLSNISVTGSIPRQLGQLTNLVTLNLKWNDKLSGSIPPELGNLKNLETLDLNSGDKEVAKLSGSIPPELGGMTSLKTLHLRNNQFTGSIPRQLGQLTNLEDLGLDGNRLTGCIPVALFSEFASTINPQRGDSILPVCPNVAPVFDSTATFSVAENVMAVGTVAATDADASDSITGYSITGGADQGKFSIDASSGALTFTNAPDFETPTDADTNNAYLVEVTATSGTSAREKTAVQAITVTVTNVVAPIPSAPTISRVTATGFTVSWTEPENPGPAITDYDVQYREGTSGTWTDVVHSGTATSLTLTTGLTAGTSYQLRVRATNAEGTSAWSATVATPGVTVSDSTLTVNENDTATYTVVLDAEPTATVTVTVAKQSGGDEHLTARPTILRFTASNWSRAQTVTVRAADDADTADGTAAFAHSASGANYLGGVTVASVTATEADDDKPGVRVSPTTRLSVLENGSATYTLVLNTQPSAEVVIAVAKQSGGDADLTASPDTFGFTPGHWSTPKTVTVSAADDTDKINGTATFTHAATSTDSDYNGVTVLSVMATEDDDELNAAPTFGGEFSFTVEENTQAVGTVTATDRDSQDKVTGYAITGGEDASLFRISNAGRLSFRGSPDFETPLGASADNVYAVAVTAIAGTGTRERRSDPRTITVTVTDVDEAPEAPKSPAISDVTASGFLVSWRLPDNPGPAIRDYTVRYRALPDGVWEERAGVEDLSLELTGLASETEYEVGVRARNAEGTGPWSQTTTGTTTVPPVPPGATVSVSALTVAENAAATYTVALDTEPTAAVTVSVSSSGDADLSVAPTALTFTPANWDTAQPVTVSAADDADTANGEATITHTAASVDSDYDGIVIASAMAAEVDDDTAGVTLSESAVTVPEASTATYSVTLDTEPTAAVTVTVSVSIDGDADLSVTPTALTFTPTDWDTAQAVTVSAADDADAANGEATIAHSASGGDYDAVAIASVTATEADDETAGVTLSESAVTVPEASTATYTIVLNAEPTAAVTVSVSASGDADLSVTPAALTFTPANWATAQPVTVSAADDADAANGKATIAHSASGGDYGSVSIASVTATETDDDTAGVTLSASAVTVPEESTASYAAVLDTEPTAAVTVSVSASGDADLSVTPAALTFTPADWDTAQAVTVSAADDADAANGEATIAHSASGGDYGSVSIASVTATETDDDTAGVTLSASAVTVPEESTASYAAVLDTEPTAAVTVSVSIDGDADLSVTPAALTFTPADWDTAQPVTVSAADDADTANGEATIAHSASGGDYGSVSIASVTATEADDDTAGVTVTPTDLAVPEASTASYTVTLDTEPTAAVTVSVSASGDADLSVTPAALTFTPADWNALQTVTVSAAVDRDTADGVATIAHSASGGGYDGVAIASVTATEADDGEPPVSGLTVESGDGEATLRWEASASAVDKYQYRRSDDGGGTWGSWMDIPGTQTAYTVTGLVNGVEYLFQVRAVRDGVGGAPSDSTAATPEQAPPGLDSPLDTVTLSVGETAHVFLASAFTGTELVYAALSGSGAVTVSTTDAGVVLTAVTVGEATVTVTASNDAGEVSQSFAVRVERGEAEAAALEAGLSALARGTLSSVETAIGSRFREDGMQGAEETGRGQLRLRGRTLDLNGDVFGEGGSGTEWLLSLAEELTGGVAPSGAVRSLLDTVRGVPGGANPAFGGTAGVGGPAAFGAAAGIDGMPGVPPGWGVGAPGLGTPGSGVSGYGGIPGSATGGTVGAGAMTPGGAVVGGGAIGTGGVASFGGDALGLGGVVDGGRPGGSGGSGGSGGGHGGFGSVVSGDGQRAGSGSGHGGGTLSGSGGRYGSALGGVDWLQGTSFELALGAGESDPSGRGRWTLWGQGDVQSFDGGEDGIDLDGEVRTGYVGLDARLGDGWVAGGAVSYSRGEVDYRSRNSGANGGRLQTRLSSVYPYARKRWDNGSEVWGVVGVGGGTAEDRWAALSTSEEADLSMTMGTVRGASRAGTSGVAGRIVAGGCGRGTDAG